MSLALISRGHEGLGATLLPTESNSWDMTQVAVGCLAGVEGCHGDIVYLPSLGGLEDGVLARS